MNEYNYIARLEDSMGNTRAIAYTQMGTIAGLSLLLPKKGISENDILPSLISIIEHTDKCIPLGNIKMGIFDQYPMYTNNNDILASIINTMSDALFTEEFDYAGIGEDGELVKIRTQSTIDIDSGSIPDKTGHLACVTIPSKNETYICIRDAIDNHHVIHHTPKELMDRITGVDDIKLQFIGFIEVDNIDSIKSSINSRIDGTSI